MKKRLLLLLLTIIAGCKSQPAENGKAVVQADANLPRWTITDTGTAVLHDPYPDNGYLVVDGFWVPTSADKGKQLPFPMAVEITCDRLEGICRENQAKVSFSALIPSEEVYTISSWSQTSVVADSESGICHIGHRLTVSLKTKGVTVVDYPTAIKANDNPLCKPLQDANSYVLHDGAITLNGPVPFDQSGIKR
jgi:hypothetical protein